MFYFYSLLQFSTVSLDQYNSWVSKMEDEGFSLPYQKTGTAFGFGFGYKLSYFEFNLEPTFFRSSVGGGGSKVIKDGVTRFFYRKHSLENYLFSAPVVLSYPVLKNLMISFGAGPTFGVSLLYVYDSVHTVRNNVVTWRVDDASLYSYSTGLKTFLSAEMGVAKNASIFLRSGYTYLKFPNYSGENERRFANGSISNTDAYWIYNPATSDIKLYPDGSSVGYECATENVSGLRLTFGIKMYL